MEDELLFALCKVSLLPRHDFHDTHCTEAKSGWASKFMCRLHENHNSQWATLKTCCINEFLLLIRIANKLEIKTTSHKPFAMKVNCWGEGKEKRKMFLSAPWAAVTINNGNWIKIWSHKTFVDQNKSRQKWSWNFVVDYFRRICILSGRLESCQSDNFYLFRVSSEIS